MDYIILLNAFKGPKYLVRMPYEPPSALPLPLPCPVLPLPLPLPFPADRQTDTKKKEYKGISTDCLKFDNPLIGFKNKELKM